MGGPDDGAPVDPFTGLLEAATQLHEMYLAYKEAGFTDQQSLYLVGVIMSASLGGTPPQP